MPQRVIDSHNHPNWLGKDVDALVRNMDEHGIEKAWLLTWEIPKAEFDAEPYNYGALDPRATGIPLWMVVEAVKRHPDRFVGGWAPDPRDRHARARLRSAVEIHGIRVYGELKLRMRYDNPDAIAMFRFCGELGLPVIFHLECPEHTLQAESKGPDHWPAWYGGDITVVDNICSLCPGTNFIGHAPGFWREISGDAARDPERYPKGPVTPGGRLFELLRRHPNLYCDLSAGSAMTALNRDPDVSRRLIIEFQDKILFGRDGYGREQFDLLEKLNLPEEVLEKVFWQNAERLLQTNAPR